MRRTLVDTSTLIAMARIGHLGRLVEILDRIHVTAAVLSEATEPDEPGASRITTHVEEERIRVVDAPLASEDLIDLGLGPGEASLIQVYEDADLLVLDDRNARRVAQARGLRYTGLLGLIVAAVERGALRPAEGMDTVRSLARGDFRMTTVLYDWARARIEACEPS